MKTGLQALVFAFLLAGILAAVSYPSHSTTMIAMGDGGAPAPACSPWDANCDSAPALGTDSTAQPVGEGSSPMPICSPWDDTCTPGPIFPKPHAQPVGEGSSPMPICSPWDDTCTPGPIFPKPHATETNSAPIS
jgi:hypothetical protein